MKLVILPLLGLALLTSCQTTSNVSPEDKALASHITTKHCILTHGWGDVKVRSEKMDDRFTVYSAVRSKERWVRFDISYDLARFNIYYNEVSGSVKCGSRSWQESGYTFTEAPVYNEPPPLAMSRVMNKKCQEASSLFPAIQNRTHHVFSFAQNGEECAHGWGHDGDIATATKDALTGCEFNKGRLRGKKSCTVFTPLTVTPDITKRDIKLSWVGEPQYREGKILLRQDRSGGTFTLVSGKDHCMGYYGKNEYGRKEWHLNCSNGRTLSGSYKPMGRGNGSAGEGKDDLGRRVTYEIAGN